MSIATIEVAVIHIVSFVVNEAPGVQARKNDELETLENFSVVFCPSEECFGGRGFITMNARRKVNVRGMGRRRVAFKIVNRISPAFRKATYPKIGELCQRAPPLNQKPIVVATRVGKCCRDLDFFISRRF